jgi:hypothetical protein
MNFEELRRSNAELKRLRQEGVLSSEEFSAELDKMRVSDSEGRVWKKEPNGNWAFQSDGQWIESDREPEEVLRPAPVTPPFLAPRQPPAVGAVPTGGLAVFLFVLSFVIPIAGLIVWAIYRQRGEEGSRLGKIALIVAGCGVLFWVIVR